MAKGDNISKQIHKNCHFYLVLLDERRCINAGNIDVFWDYCANAK